MKKYTENNSIVFVKLPHAGLCNQLFSLMKAVVHSNLTGQNFRVCNYNQLKIGPYIRFEKTKRKYNKFFKFQKGLLDDFMTRFLIYYLIKRERVIFNPPINSKIAISSLFYHYPHWSNYFEGLNEYRQMVKKCLFEILNPKILENYHNVSSPEVGLHVRLGDFRKLKIGENFNIVGAVRTPEYYFIDIIRKLREFNGFDLPITIFTNGYKEDMPELFSLPNVIIPKPNSDIGDLLHLSKSKIIVTSAGSTFSYWAGFLSESPIILHPDYIHKPIRIDKNLFEGPIDLYLDLLKNDL
jgi:hypothetical protein